MFTKRVQWFCQPATNCVFEFEIPWQVLVDTDTPGEVCTVLKEILDPWFEARSTELRPDPTVAFFGPSTDPMKASQLAAWGSRTSKQQSIPFASAPQSSSPTFRLVPTQNRSHGGKSYQVVWEWVRQDSNVHLLLFFPRSSSPTP